MAADFDELGDQVHGDLSRRLDEHDGSMVVKFLALVELIDADGARSIASLTSRGLKSWESLGMLDFARQLEQSSSVQQYRSDDQE